MSFRPGIQRGSIRESERKEEGRNPTGRPVGMTPERVITNATPPKTDVSAFMQLIRANIRVQALFGSHYRVSAPRRFFAQRVRLLLREVCQS